MARSWTIGQQLAVAFTLPILILASMAAASYWSTERLVTAGRALAHTHEVRRSVSTLLAALTEAESAQRGFVITGAEALLPTYRAAVTDAHARQAELRALTTDNSKQQNRLDRLRPLVQDQLNELAQTIDLRKSEGGEAAARRVGEGRSTRTMEEIRNISKEVMDAEGALLQIRDRERTSAVRSLEMTLFGGALLGVGAMLLLGRGLARKLVRKIDSAATDVRGSSDELEDTATQQARGSREQVKASTEVSSTVRELVSTSREIARSAQLVTRTASATASAAEAGEATVEGAQAALIGIKQQVDRIVLHMQGLGKKSQEVGGILDLIDDLAEQTTILAINATIESVGAGDAGRRFSVVADAIRRLADRVSASTRDVHHLIEDIRTAASVTISATEEGQRAVHSSMRQFIDVTSSFRQISDYVVSTAEAAEAIEFSTKQQTSAIEQVSLSIDEVAETARTVEATSARALATASQLSQVSRGLLGLIQRDPASAATEA